MGVSPEMAPDKPTYVTLSFEKGIPVAVDGKQLDPVAMMEYLNKLGGENGVGLCDLVENRLVGMKSRGVYETPGGTILYRAHQVLETICLDRDTQHYKELVANRYAELVYFGQWFTPLREALAAFVTETQKTVTGEVKLKLYKGNIINAGVTSPYSLYSEEIATFGEDHVYDQKDAAGFINLFGLPYSLTATREPRACGSESASPGGRTSCFSLSRRKSARTSTPAPPWPARPTPPSSACPTPPAASWWPPWASRKA